MKTGLLENVLIRRYGKPVPSIRRGLPARCWNPDEFDYASVLYLGMKWQSEVGARFSSLKEVYGDACGGFLIKNTLKVAILLPREVYGLWNIDELRMQPEVQHAQTIDPGIDFFMDANNMFFYGIKAGHLYVFDSETDELDPLGPIESALENLMEEFESAREEVRER